MMSSFLIADCLFSGCFLEPGQRPNPNLIPYQVVQFTPPESVYHHAPSWNAARCHIECLENRKCASSMFSSDNSTCSFHLTMSHDTLNVTVTPENNITTLDKYCYSDLGKLMKLGKKRSILFYLTTKANKYF